MKKFFLFALIVGILLLLSGCDGETIFDAETVKMVDSVSQGSETELPKSTAVDDSSQTSIETTGPIETESAPESSTDDKGSEETESETETIAEKVYVVRFLDEDGTLLYECEVNEGKDVVYPFDQPTKPADGELVFEFSGWDADLTSVKSDMTLRATYRVTSDVDWGEINWF